MQSTRFAIVGGNGAVGRLFTKALASDDAGREVAIVDRTAVPPLDVRSPSPALTDALGLADCVVLAVPEAVALDALPQVLDAMRPGALLVDTLSVKTPYLAAASAAGAPVELLSLNPMFAPDLGLSGQAVLAVEPTGGPRSDELLALLRRDAAVVTVADAAAHDRMTAALQVAAHASLLGLGVGLTELDGDLDALLAVAPPPFVALLALLARIASGSPATYADIQLANPHAGEARAALAAGLARLDDAARGGDPAHVEALLAQVRTLLGDAREPLAAQAATLLAQVRRPG